MHEMWGELEVAPSSTWTLRWLRVLRSHAALDTAQVAARASYRF